MKIKSAVAVAVASMVLMAGCSSSTPSTEESGGGTGSDENLSCSTEIKKDVPVVTMWAWYPAFENIVDHFNETHTDVQVCWNNVGVNIDEYTKFNTALEAGTGAPDVIMLEGAIVPSYVINGGIVDLTEFGAGDLKKNFSDGAWADVSSGDGVFAVPIDGGPMGMLVRQDIFDEHGVSVPTTWSEFEVAAADLKAAGYEGYITNFPLNGKAFIQAMFANNGATPYAYDVTDQSVSINLTDGSVVEVLEYWKKLADADLVSTNDRTTAEDNARLLDGSYATYLAAAWGPGYLTGLTETGVPDGEWRAHTLPQWDLSAPIDVNWGGSTFAVTKQAKNAELSAQVAKEILGTEEAWEIGVEKSALFPLWQNILQSDEFRMQEYPFFGDQKINDDVFVDAAEGYTGFSVTPFQNYVYDVTNKALADFFAGDITGQEAATAIETDLKNYAEKQGFTVK